MKKRIHIHIGEFHASSTPAVIHTLLGSCVAVCLFDPVKRAGGMNHILMPGQSTRINFRDSARYGLMAMELLMDGLLGLGCKPDHLVAKVFGGAHILPAISKKNGVGGKNISFVLDFLENKNIRIIGMDAGGHDSRKIFFHTDTGKVLLKRIPPLLMNRKGEY